MKKLGKLYQRWVEVVWAGEAEGSGEHIGLDHRGARRFRAVHRELESSRWRREVILEVVGCPWDMRLVGRISPPDAYGLNGEEVRSLDGLPKMPERDRYCWRRRPLLSRHRYLQLTWQSTDRSPRREAKKRGHEDRGRDAVMVAPDSLQGQVSSSSQWERNDSSKVRLETWIAEQEPGADDEEEQPGAEEMALERKKQFEAVCPLLLETGEVVAAPTLEDLTPAMLVCSTHMLQGADSSCSLGWGEAHQEKVA